MGKRERMLLSESDSQRNGMNFSLITLGELLSSPNETIKRNAFSILKQLQKERDREQHAFTTL